MNTVRKIYILKGTTIVILLCLSFVINILSAQDLLWKANLTGTNHNYPSKSVIDSQNNIYVLGSFKGTLDGPIGTLTTKGLNDIFIAKYDANGVLLWVKQIGSDADDYGLGIAVSPDDNFIYVTGVFQDIAYADNLNISSVGEFDGFLAKYDKNGNIKKFLNFASGTGAYTQRPMEIKIDNSNHLIIGGYFNNNITLGTYSFSTLSTQTGFFISQCDTAGNVLNAKEFEATSGSMFYSFDVDNSGYYLCGYYKGNLVTDLGTKTSNSNSLDMFVYKVDVNLSGNWIINIGGNSTEVLTSSSVDNQGNIYIGGYFASSSLIVDSTSTGISSIKTIHNNGLYDVFFAKYNSSGVLQWFNTAGSTGNDILYRALYKNGDFIVAGQCGGNLTFNNQTLICKGNGDAFAIVHDNNDNLKYLIPIGGSTGTETGETAVVDNNGNFVVIGDYTSSEIYFGNNPGSMVNSHAGTKDMFVAKYDKGSLNKVVLPVLCAGTSTGSINITPMGTVVEPYTYAWSKRGDGTFSSNNEDLNGVSAGTYKVTFTDALGYTKIDSVTLTDPAPLTVALTSQSDATCFNGTNGTINITPAGGTLPYSYVWNTNSGSGMDATSQDQIAISAGTYAVSVNDINGCTIGLNNIIINQPAKIVFSGTTVTDIVNPSFGSVNLSLHGGTPSYNYAWQGPSGFTATTQDISNLSNVGTYSVHVVDSKGCTSDTSVLVNDGTLLIAYIQAQQNVSCHGGSNGGGTVGVSNASGTLSYLWDDASATTTSTISNLAAGTYHVTVTDDRGGGDIKTSSATLVITEPLVLQLSSINKLDISCYDKPDDGILDATITGGTVPYTYNWTKDGVYFNSSEDLTGLSQGSYALTVTDANLCTVSGSNNIARPLPISIAATIDSVTCEGSRNDGAINLSVPTGGWPAYSYLWSNGLTTQSINLLSTGSYSVTVSDSRNCKATLSKYVDYEAPISITFNVNDVLCKGASTGNANALVSGGHSPISYQWSNGTTNSAVANVVAGSYTVTVTDNKLCTKLKSITINEPLVALDVTKGTSGDVTCPGGTNGFINISGTGGTPAYRYGWSDGTVGSSVTNLSSGDYTVTVIDNNGCSLTKTYNVAQPANLVLTEKLTSHVDLLCNGGTTGVIEVQATGGTGAFQYSMNNGTWVSSPVFSGLAGNSYSFRVQDAASCINSMSQNINIIEPSPISQVSLNKSDVSCQGMGNGTISLSASGGTGSLNYLLKLNGTLTGNTTGASSGIFTNITPATGYTIEVNDANNCGPFVSDLSTITEPQPITVGTLSNTNVSCNGMNDGAISLSAMGGNSPLTYSLKLNGSASSNISGETSGIFTNVIPGNNYTIEVNDANNCGIITSGSADIYEPRAISIMKDSVQDATSNSPWNGTRLVVATGGTGPLMYSLSSQIQDTGIFTGLAPGTYTITVIDQNNCGPVNSSALTISYATDIPGLKHDKLRIYPNPVHDEVTLDFGNALSEILQIEVIAVNGQSYYKENSSTNDGKIKMNLGSLARGLYLLKINNEVLKEKLILQ